MDPREAESYLAGGGVVGGHLQAEIEKANRRLQSTNQDITRLNGHAARLKMLKNRAQGTLHANDGIVIVDTVSNCLVALESAILLLEAKNESLEATINIATLAQSALDTYGNKIPAIPKNE